MWGWCLGSWWFLLTLSIHSSILYPMTHAFLSWIGRGPSHFQSCRSCRQRGLPNRQFRSTRSSSLSSSSSIVTITEYLSFKLHDPSILLDWNPSHIDTWNVARFPVHDPAKTDTVLAHVPSFSSKTVHATLQASQDAFKRWRDGTTAAYRGTLLQEWSSLMKQNIHDLATIMTLESGKPWAESKGEVLYAASFLDYFAGEAVRSTNAGFLIPTPFTQPPSSQPTESNPGGPRGQLLAHYEPIGVSAMITPWNFPLAMITRKVGPAMAAGCTAIVKPSDLTPLSAIALATLAYRVGFPPPVLALLTAAPHEDTVAVGQAFCTNPIVKKISFTGSTPVGKWLLEQSASTVKRVSLELGGNAPFIVFDDANLDQAVTAAMASKFRNAGQTCVCADRFLLHSSIHDDFIQLLKDKITQTILTNVGHGLDPSTTLGPLISMPAIDAVHQKVQQALAMGAQCHLGGSRMPGLGSEQFYQPTILSHVPLDADLWNKEIFGPVVAIRSFDTEKEALEIANDSSVGLAAYFCTQDLGRTFRVSKKLECGIVGVNEGIISTCAAPFGGIKESGLGREGSSLGLAEYLETKYVFINY